MSEGQTDSQRSFNPKNGGTQVKNDCLEDFQKRKKPAK